MTTKPNKTNGTATVPTQEQEGYMSALNVLMNFFEYRTIV